MNSHKGSEKGKADLCMIRKAMCNRQPGTLWYVKGEPQVGRDCKGERCRRAGPGKHQPLLTIALLTAELLALQQQQNRTMPALVVGKLLQC